MNWSSTQPRVSSVRATDGYRVELVFNDGARGVVDIQDWIVGRGGVMTELEDLEMFSRVRVNAEAGTIEWPNGVDFCPDVLYAKLTGKPVPFAESERTSIK